MASRAYIFRLAIQDLREVGADFGFSDLHEKILDRGDFIMLVSGTSRTETGNVFTLAE
jgi:hypothetical protein